MSTLCRNTHPLAGPCLPYRGGDSLQVTDLVRPRDGVHRALYPKGVHGKLHHWREALAAQLSTAGKELSSRGVQVDRDGEQ